MPATDIRIRNRSRFYELWKLISEILERCAINCIPFPFVELMLVVEPEKWFRAAYFGAGGAGEGRRRGRGDDSRVKHV